MNRENKLEIDYGLKMMLQNFESVSVLILDRSYKYIMLNNNHKEFMKELLGIEIEVGMNILDIIYKNVRDDIKENLVFRIKQKLENAFNGNKVITNEELLVKKNEIEYFQAEVIPIKDSNGSIYAVGVYVLNITDKINSMKYSLKKKLDISSEYDEKSSFLRNISHEIRTPINGIIGLTDILLKDELNFKQRQYMMSIRHSAASLLENIENILYNCKNESSKLQIQYKEFNFYKFIDNIKNIFLAKGEETKIKVKYSIGEDIPQWIIGDDLLLQRLLINLISNSLKLSSSREMEVNITKESKFIYHYNKKGIRLRFTIKYLGHELNKKDTIQIIKELIKDLDGNIEFNSNYSKNKINMDIPFILSNKVEENIGADGIKENIELGANEGICENKFNELDKLENIKILVAEDNLVNQMVISELIKILGWEGKVVNNGKQAIEELENDNYNLVLMDISMPEMNGLEAMKIIKSKKRFKEIPIIALTAYALVEDKEKLIELGMDDYLSKPIDKERLYYMVNKHLNLDNEYFNGFRRLEKVLDGNTELIFELGNKIIQIFSKEQMNEIIELSNNGQIVELREVIHKLKGAISNFKLTEIIEALNNIKEKAINGEIYLVYELTDKINRNIEKFQEKLIEYCNKH
ncbi:CheY-like chemotaxis protein [Clostridium tetanomorphum]|uniref:response regulator n=1 Tax=Clostridium tetanomorphum TaxID=1553 RepID=UPI00045108FD|nr:response regulator [Clostridium tetanomorphum]KAJ51998.1 response regulator [Clostridium tetanomorphum DSM 665]MBP1862918.1 CheY-like chemotaxis protein [Clostridium tetanomorphum]NRS87055.1 CheY-like chemotaxis protein [Clostridium tetanomorphum]SQC00137.1 response regulator [Clostridium tetanomorphum]